MWTHMKPMPERISGMPMCQFLSRNFLLLQAMYVLHSRHASGHPRFDPDCVCSRLKPRLQAHVQPETDCAG